MSNLYVKPAKEGVVVRLPWRPAHPVPPEGMFVPYTGFIRRRLAKGDLVRAEVPKKTAPVASPAKAKPKAKSEEQES